MKKFIITIFFLMFLTSNSWGICTAEKAKKAVVDACKILKDNITLENNNRYNKLDKFRFCNSKINYVWVQIYDKSGKTVTLSYHPISEGLVGKDMMLQKGKIKKKFLRLGEALNKSYKSEVPEPVKYKWAKPGLAKESDKISYMLKCTTGEGIGGGYWIN